MREILSNIFSKILVRVVACGDISWPAVTGTLRPAPWPLVLPRKFRGRVGGAQQCGKTMTMNFKLQAEPTRNAECGTWNCEWVRECSWAGRNCTGVKWRNGAEMVEKRCSFPGPLIGPEPVYRRKRRERSRQELEFVWLYSPSQPLLHRFRRKQRRGLFCFSAIFPIDTPSTRL